MMNTQEPLPPHAEVKRVVHLSVDERVARGMAARRAAPRSSAGTFDARSDRDPIGLLQQQAATRVAELVPLRYGRMLASPFTFYRGAALVMAADLAGSPVSGLDAQICGDAHLSNFGVFASPERALVFDINDFDETHRGPWEWDVKRLVASFDIACRDVGMSATRRAEVCTALTMAYRDAMVEFTELGNLELWHRQLDADQLTEQLRGSVSKERMKTVKKGIAKARTRDSLQAELKLTELVDGRRRFRSEPPILVPLSELTPAGMSAEKMFDRLRDILRDYRATLQSDRRHLLETYELVDVARKVVGVGSVGTRAWVALLVGKDDADPLMLQIKEAQASVLESFVGGSGHRSAGARVVAGQRLMQTTSDMFLGWIRTAGFDVEVRDFYFRQLRDWKGSADVSTFNQADATAYGRMCAWALAKGHARSGDRVSIAAYLGSGAAFAESMTAFAAAYADQNERDHAALQAAVSAGRIAVEIE